MRVILSTFVYMLLLASSSFASESSFPKNLVSDVVVDLSSIKPGQLKLTVWHNVSILIYRRTKAEIEQLLSSDKSLFTNPDNEGFNYELKRLSRFGNTLPQYLNIDQPKLDQTLLRSKKKEFFIAVNQSTGSGCVPLFAPKGSKYAPDSKWVGGFISPCSKARYDFAGRVLKGSKHSQNLYIPPHQFIADQKLLIGVGNRSFEPYDFDNTDYRNLSPDEGLITGAYFGKLDEVKKALIAGANPNVRDIHGNTPLFSAVATESREIAQNISLILLRNGADPNIVNNFGRTPLSLAVIRDSDPVIRLLLKHNANPNPFCRDGRCAANYFCDMLIPNNMQNNIMLLLENGALPLAEDSNGNSAIECAKRSGNKGIVAILEARNE